ncbi:hypothetical protein K0504_00625 [Neiella marina]|uniref:Uncharacterized protein n=1 Tax=Neiella holothuriorum TaxID=2870530 RepID=A0ABS7EB09_9GAMM|nr:hypothetical protein [Neiella holothuriorum]MBW8189522.1 hypothetical protein [Neiella holothuriorum]
MILIDGDHNAIELEFQLMEQQLVNKSQSAAKDRAAEVDAASEVGALLPGNIEPVDYK